MHCLTFSMWIYINNLDQVIWLAENWKWAWHHNLFSMTRVKHSQVYTKGIQNRYTLYMHTNQSFKFRPRGYKTFFMLNSAELEIFSANKYHLSEIATADMQTLLSRSPKSSQFLALSQQYSCTSLVKIHPFILEIGCRKAIFQQSEPSYDLENRVKVTKI